jgi:hypothetical protein
MKHTILALAFTVSALGAQMDYTTFQYELQTKPLDIQVTEEGKIYVTMVSLDKTSKSAGMILTSKKAEDLIVELTAARDKFIEWKAVAIKNGVTDVEKPMDLSLSCSGFFTYGKWQFDFSVKPELTFRVMDLGAGVKQLLILKTGQMTSSSNQFMETTGGVIVFKDAEQINDFISKIKTESVQKFLAKPKDEELFR